MDNASQSDFSWEPFYKSLANKLAGFYNNRPALIELISQIFEETGIRMPKLSNSDTLTNIDPFTAFGLFNKHPQRAANRTKLLEAFANHLGISDPAPTSFDSLPVLMALNASFYPLDGDHVDEDIENLWQLFLSAIAYANDPSLENKALFSSSFDSCINIKGNDNGKITMALYWISPETYLNLDSRNVWYIYDSKKLPADFVSTLPAVVSKIPSSTYLKILTKINQYLSSEASPFHGLKELSLEAWRYSEEVNQRNKKSEALPAPDPDQPRYWLYAPGSNARFWHEFHEKGIMAIGWDAIGDLKSYSSKDEIRQALCDTLDPTKSYKHSANAAWQFANVMKPGDIIIVKKGRQELIGRGIVDSDYYFDDSRTEYKNVRKVTWTHNGHWAHPTSDSAMKTLTDITDRTEYVRELNNLFLEEDDETSAAPASSDPYTKDDFLKEVYLDEAEYDTLVDRLRIRKNIILQGAPGVGKTFAATRLAYSMMGVKDSSRINLVQFHQSYSYEDFVMGIRPTESGNFAPKPGVFYNFCKEAEADSDNEYFFIIDEINRGNLSKIFGETFMLMEGDKRGQKVQLLYAEEKFSIPENLYLIGMMNTADRSLALIDYALRRRFVFFDMAPAFDQTNFQSYQKSLNSPTFDRLISAVKSLNAEIADDPALGKGFRIGHSYFCGLDSSTNLLAELNSIVEYELIPLLEEYYFDDAAKAEAAAHTLRNALRDTH